MTKIIDGEGAVLGRLASFAAKEALLGEEIVILNCERVIITGNKADIKEKYESKRKKIGSGQMGPKHSRIAHKIVKRAIRGMLAHRMGRGKDALRRIMCYEGVPDNFKDSKKIKFQDKKKKFVMVDILTK